MKKKAPLIAVLLAALYIAGQYSAWTVQRFDYVYNYMYEFTSPGVRSLLSMGHDALVADLSLIRGIQFYGRNYPLLDKHPVKYEQFHSLGTSVSQIDKRYEGAYRFWGFAFTSAERGKVDAYRFLIHGAHQLSATDDLKAATGPAFGAVFPDLWKVAKDAGYVAVYELKSETPEWGCSAYKLAQLSSDCPDFIRRLEYFACRSIEPDPLPPLMELAHDAASTDNVALKTLNVDHIKRIVAQEHKTFWKFAEDVYREIHNATPTKISDLKTVQIMKEATQRYREMSAKWFTDATTRLFPNLVNPVTAVQDNPMVREAVEPEMPIDPYGGEYLILTIEGKAELVSTGICMDERRDFLAGYNAALDDYRKNHDGQCPPDIDTFEKTFDEKLVRADMYGYPLLFNAQSCSFAFPPISEEAQPSMAPYAGRLKEAEGEGESPASVTDELSPPPQTGK